MDYGAFELTPSFYNYILHKKLLFRKKKFALIPEQILTVDLNVIPKFRHKKTMLEKYSMTTGLSNF